MPNHEKQYYRDGIPVSKEKFPYAGDIKYEDALGYLKRVALEHKEDEPILVVLMGDRNVGKTTFAKELMENVWKEKPESRVVIYKFTGDPGNEFEKFKKLKESTLGARFPMVIWEVNGIFSPDVQSAVELGVLPQTFIYMYDPKREQRPNRGALLQDIMKVRADITKQFGILSEQPEILIVQNPEAGSK